MEDVNRLQIDDLINEPTFIQYVHGLDAPAVTHWENVIAQYPDKQEVFKAARLIIQGIKFNPQTLSDQTIQHEWERLENSIAWQNNKRRVWYRWAASVAALAFLTTFVWWHVKPAHDLEVATAYGEIQDVTLPDGSVVTLSANSSLAYDQWNEHIPREVWLTGEAFFEIKKTPQRQDPRFIVRSNDTEVQVLGTSFDVNNRRGETTVVLTTGKVAFQKSGQDTTTRVIMQPGDLVTISPALNTVKKKRVNPAVYSAWKEHKFIFDNTPLREVALMIQEYYGIPVLIKDEALKNKLLSGEITVSDIDVLLSALAPFGIRITKKADQIIMEEKM